MQIHGILLRQLKRYQLSATECPTQLKQWQQFLDRINHTYTEIDQDRYLSERSQEISNKEMNSLYSELKQAQSIAHLGGWSYDDETKKITLSAESLNLLHLGFSSPPVTRHQILKMIYFEDRLHFKKLMRNALEYDRNFETEIRIYVNGYIHWIEIIGESVQPVINIPIINKKIAGTIMDITQRKSTELKQTMEHAIVRSLIETDSLFDIMPDILKIICETFSCQVGIAWKNCIDDNLWQPQFTYNQKKIDIKKFMHLITENTAKSNLSYLVHEVLKNKEIIFNELSKMPEFYDQLIAQFNIHSAFTFAIEAENHLILILEFFSVANDKLDKSSIQSINSIRYQIRNFIEKKWAQEREIELNNQLLSAARQAGMAEVATSVLHNVGNVLNSINVTVLLLTEKLRSTKLSNLAKIAQLVQTHSVNLGDYIANDPKGKLISEYIIQLADYWQHEQEELLTEIGNLNENIAHVKTIIATQQSSSNVTGLIAPNFIDEILEESLKICVASIKKSRIKIEREYNTTPQLLLDKIKLQQILVNLINNAKDALILSKNSEKWIKMRIIDKNESVQIQIIDNGIGIEPQNLPKIFSYGFTTKKGGHGFGLYMSALAAKEMYFSLKGDSEGLNKGATFTLEIPKKTDNDANE